jgi:alkylation response protein AidB-like acyl-CoA dehydrogenase
MAKVPEAPASGAASQDAGDVSPIAEIEAEVRKFASRELDAGVIEARGSIGAPLLAEAAALGLFGASLPTEFGGFGLKLGEITRVVSALAEHDRALATCVGLHSGLGTRGLVTLGNDALRAKWLPLLAEGKRVASFAATESGAGSNLAAVSTKATLDGDDVILDGEKIWVTNGGFAGVFTVLARSPGINATQGHVLVLVPRETPGVEIGAEEHKMGLYASSTITLRLDNVRLPRSHILGTPGRGLEDAQAILAFGRTVLASGCLGTTRAALRMSLAHTAERRQFGRALIEMEPVRAHLSHIAATVRTLERMLAAIGQDDATGVSIASTSAAVKVVASEGSCDAGDRAIQLHGGSGYIEDTGVPRLYRDSRVTRIFEGTNDVLILHLGTVLLAGMPGNERITQASSHPEVALRRESLLGFLAATRKAYGVGAIRKQLLLTAIGRAAIAYYSAACVAGDGIVQDAVDAVAIRNALRSVDDYLRAAGTALSDAEGDEAALVSLGVSTRGKAAAAPR